MMNITKTRLLFSVLSLTIGIQSSALGAGTTIISVNGMGGRTAVGIAFDSVSSGRVCGTITGTPPIVRESPVGGCTGVNGPIPPSRIVSFIDAAGNRFDAESSKIPILGFFKGWLVSADTRTINLPTSALAHFQDPLTFSNPTGESFDVNLVRSLQDLKISGDKEFGGSASGQYNLGMSTDITGFLFSLDIKFELDQPLEVDLNVGSFLQRFPDWNEASLESELKSLLDANNPDNEFTLSNYSFPDIPINVPAGQSLNVFTSDTVAVVATVPEPSSTLSLLAIGIGGAASTLNRKLKKSKSTEKETEKVS